MAPRRIEALTPVPRNSLFYSLIIPAYNESSNIEFALTPFVERLCAEGIPHELVVVNDNSTDDTVRIVEKACSESPGIRLVHNRPPRGFGRAVRCGLEHAKGDAIALVMADRSDSPDDVVQCYRTLEEGYDCVFGSRFIRGSTVSHYPLVKRAVNRMVNSLIRVMFMTRHNDMTNAFKVYRRYVIESISPLQSAHFNITIELSLSALIRKYRIATVPISWSGRTWGVSNLKLRAMGRRYLATLLKIWFERLLVVDDLIQEIDAKAAESRARSEDVADDSDASSGLEH